mmetsp:Transcript_23433/g.72069  ORF Transcript_23433/g.72069 Transcript_23433/m.72069 type:complete len:208 (-) Transcript_23433:893-1516(-)
MATMAATSSLLGGVCGLRRGWKKRCAAWCCLSSCRRRWCLEEEALAARAFWRSRSARTSSGRAARTSSSSSSADGASYRFLPEGEGSSFFGLAPLPLPTRKASMRGAAESAATSSGSLRPTLRLMRDLPRGLRSRRRSSATARTRRRRESPSKARRPARRRDVRPSATSNRAATMTASAKRGSLGRRTSIFLASLSTRASSGASPAA